MKTRCIRTSSPCAERHVVPDGDLRHVPSLRGNGNAAQRLADGPRTHQQGLGLVLRLGLAALHDLDESDVEALGAELA